MERNIGLLRQVYRQIKDNPETHEQGMWVARRAGCGTTGCVAGWGVMLGAPEAELEWRRSLSLGREVVAYALPPGKINKVGIGVYAAELLGLEPDERDWLFHEDRTRAEVLGALADLIRGESTEYMDYAYDPEDYDWSDAEADDIDRPSAELAAEIDALEEADDPYGPSLDADWGLADVEFQELHA